MVHWLFLGVDVRIDGGIRKKEVKSCIFTRGTIFFFLSLPLSSRLASTGTLFREVARLVRVTLFPT